MVWLIIFITPVLDTEFHTRHIIVIPSLDNAHDYNYNTIIQN